MGFSNYLYNVIASLPSSLVVIRKGMEVGISVVKISIMYGVRKKFELNLV